MALTQINHMSKALFRIVPLNVILPADRFDADTDQYLIKKMQVLTGTFGQPDQESA